MEIRETDSLVDIRKGGLLEIKQMRALLAENGIPSLLGGAGQACGKGCCGGPEAVLMVHGHDVQHALDVLEKEYIASTGLHEHDQSFCAAVFDATSKEAVCPACGFTFSTDLTVCPDCGLCFA